MISYHKIYGWIPVVLWMCLIFWFSSRPAMHTSQIYWQDFIVKKTAHFIEYFILAVLIFRALKQSTEYSRVVLILLTLLVTVVYASTDEYHQSLVPGREPRYRDVAIDSLGVVTASVLISLRKLDILIDL